MYDRRGGSFLQLLFCKTSLSSAPIYYIHMEVYLIENGTDAVLGDPGTRHASLRVP